MPANRQLRRKLEDGGKKGLRRVRDGYCEAKTMSECGIASGLVGRRNQLPEMLKEGVHFKETVDSTQGGSSDVRLRRIW